MSNTAFNERMRRISLLAALVAPMLTACGGGSGGSAETPAPPPPAPAPTTTLSLLAGNTDGPGNQDGPTSTTARIGSPGGMALTSTGEVIIADIGNARIRKLSANHEQLSTLAGSGVGVAPGSQSPNYADGAGSSARFHNPQAVAVDAAGNTYVADARNHLVRKISASGAVTTLAGRAGVCGNDNGVGSAATLCEPTSIAVDKSGTVYVSEIKRSPQTAMSVANPIRKITATGTVSTLTSKASQYPSLGYVSGPAVEWYHPVLLATDSAGTLYAADPNDHVIRKYAADGQASVLSGTVAPRNEGSTDGPASVAQFGDLQAISFDPADRLFVLDNNGRPAIRQIGSDGSATTLVRASSCSIPTNLVPGTLCTASQMVAKAGGQFLVAEVGIGNSQSNHYSQLRSYTVQGASTVVAGLPSAAGSSDGQGGTARFDTPSSLAFNPAGTLYVRDNLNRTIRTVQTDGLVRTLGKPDGHCTAVTGMGDEVLSSFFAPLATDSAGNLYTIQEGRILKTRNCEATLLTDLTPALDKVPTLFSSAASGIVADSVGNIFVSTLKGAIFKIDAKGKATLFAGSVGTVGHLDGQGTAAQFSVLGNMTIDAAGNLYVVDGLFQDKTKIGPTIRKITSTGTVTTLAGNPAAAQGYADGSGAAAVFTVNHEFGSNQPTASLATDKNGNVYVTDPINHVIRKITPDGRVTTPVGQAWRQGFAAGDLPGIINRPMGIGIRDSMMYITVPNAVLQVKLP